MIMDLDNKLPLSLRQYLIPVFLIVIAVLLTIYYINREVILKEFVLQRIRSSAEKVQTDSTSTQFSKMFFVDIEGAILNPGVYEIEENKRVNDVITLAGGFTEYVDLHTVNQTINKAQKINDGMKLFIPSVNDAVTVISTEDTAQSKLISINTATKDELDTLPGVGAVTADKIITGRPYNDVSDLVTKKVLTNSQYEKIKDLVIP